MEAVSIVSYSFVGLDGDGVRGAGNLDVVCIGNGGRQLPAIPGGKDATFRRAENHSGDASQFLQPSRCIESFQRT